SFTRISNSFFPQTTSNTTSCPRPSPVTYLIALLHASTTASSHASISAPAKPWSARNAFMCADACRTFARSHSSRTRRTAGRETGTVCSAISLPRFEVLLRFVYNLENPMHPRQLENLLHWRRRVHQPHRSIPIARRLVQRNQRPEPATI